METIVAGTQNTLGTVGVLENGTLNSVQGGSIVALDGILDLARGNISGMTHVNKFGRAVAGVQTTSTDIWDRADATPTQQIWVAPTQARVHDIASTVNGDTAAGTGARTMEVFGLTDWDTAETSEVVILNGTAGTQTSNSYVVIHRMKVLTKGADHVNAGVITATAQTDSTVTAQINVDEGQTQMAIYGFPSIQTAYVTQFYSTINRQSASAAAVNFSLVFNPEPQTELTNFQVKNTRGLQSTGASSGNFPFLPYAKFTGPGILKVQGIASAADVEASSGFDIILVDN